MSLDKKGNIKLSSAKTKELDKALLSSPSIAGAYDQIQAVYEGALSKKGDSAEQQAAQKQYAALLTQAYLTENKGLREQATQIDLTIREYVANSNNEMSSKAIATELFKDQSDEEKQKIKQIIQHNPTYQTVKDMEKKSISPDKRKQQFQGLTWEKITSAINKICPKSNDFKVETAIQLISCIKVLYVFFITKFV